MKDYEIKLPEGIKETETKIYKVDYQEDRVSFYMLFASKEKALEFADGIENGSDVTYIAVTERTAVDGGIFEPSGLIKESGRYNAN